MDNHQLLAEQFEANRSHLQGVAYRMLGSLTEADDAVQEAWLRFSRSDTSGIENQRAWLTTVVARVCLDMLRSHTARREQPLDAPRVKIRASGERSADPEQEAMLADAVGLALLVVLNTLDPAERLAFVLHDIFAVPFETIAPIVDRSEAATRQLASRARRRVQAPAKVKDAAALAQQREMVSAFLAASREGSFDALLSMLDPNVVLRMDQTLAREGQPSEFQGAQTVAQMFLGNAQAARPALVDGMVGAIVAPRGRLMLVLLIKLSDGKVTEIEAVGDPARLRQMRFAVLDIQS